MSSAYDRFPKWQSRGCPTWTGLGCKSCGAARVREDADKSRVRTTARECQARFALRKDILFRRKSAFSHPRTKLNPPNMTQVISSSGHDDMIHDAVLDYYGRRLATCSSDKTIKIFEIEGDQHKLTETLKGYKTTTTKSQFSALTA